MRYYLRTRRPRNNLNLVLARQLPDADKRTRADFVIETGGPIAATKAQVGRILACLGLATGV